MSEDIRELGVQSRLLQCHLTDSELLEYGNELGKVVQDITTEEDRQASLKQELKSRLTALEAKRSELASKITRKEELRNVDVESELNFEDGVYRETRFDTGEVIKERPITEEERQEDLAINKQS